MDESLLTEAEIALTLEALIRARERGVKPPRGPKTLAKIIEQHGGNPAVAEMFRRMPPHAVRRWLEVFELNLTAPPSHAPPPDISGRPNEGVLRPAPPVLDDAAKRRAVEVFAAFHDAGIGGDQSMTDEVGIAFQLYVLDGIGSPHAVVAAACRGRER